MVRSIIILMLVVLFSCSTALAQEIGLGLGIIVGEPTGLSWKKWTGTTTAIDGAVAWSFGNESILHLHADYLLHKVAKGKLSFYYYYGIGGRIKFGEYKSGKHKGRIGVRIPLGIDYIPANLPLDIFFELVPLLDLVPGTDFGLNGAIGIRYYFR